MPCLLISLTVHFLIAALYLTAVSCRVLHHDQRSGSLFSLWSTAADLTWPFSGASVPHLENHRKRCNPENVHIALNSHPSEMTIMWMTYHSRCPTSVKFWQTNSFSAYKGHSQIVSKRHQHGTSSSLTAKDMCGEPARSNSYEKTWQHSVVLTALEPGQQYSYVVGDDLTTYSFTAAPPIGEFPAGSGANMSFIMYGDMGVSSAQSVLDAVREEVSQRHSSLVFHVGDVSYGDGKGKVWYNFMQEISSFATSTPYMVGVGNHDYDYSRGKRRKDPSNALPFRPTWAKFSGDSRGECGVALQARFQMPDNGIKHKPENPPFWYSFEHGLIHFVMLSSEHTIRRHTKQWEWLVAHLQSIDRCKTPWVVVGFHRPLYAIHPHRANRVIAKYLRHQLEDVLVKYGVDVVASGHVHAYSRSCPVIGKQCVPFEKGSVLHVITGSGGRKLSNVKRHQPRWVDAAQRAWGFSRFTVVETGEGESEMVVEFVNAEDGAVTDSITLRNSLRRDQHCSYCYSRSNGAVLGSPVLHGTAAAGEVAAECGAGHGSGDLDALAQERLAAEHPQWAAVLQDELPTEWMLWAAEELDPDFAAGMSGRWKNTSSPPTPGRDATGSSSNMLPLHSPLDDLFSLDDPDDGEDSNLY